VENFRAEAGCTEEFQLFRIGVKSTYFKVSGSCFIENQANFKKCAFLCLEKYVLFDVPNKCAFLCPALDTQS